MTIMIIYGLTTKDNPYDYFNKFDEWLAYDMSRNYGTLELLARFAKTSDEFSEFENQEQTLMAIDRIIEIDFEGKYTKVQTEIDDDN